MVKNNVLFFLFFLLPNLLCSQTTDANNYFGQDSYGALYYEIENTLYKKTDETTFQYANYSFGKITTVDSNNPLRVLLFYKNFNTVILLDNQYNEVQRISLNNETTTVMMAYAGMAALNKIWMVDQNTNRILLYDWNTKIIKTLTPPVYPTIKYFKTTLNFAYWVDENNNLYQCDLFGSILLRGKLPEFESFQIIDNQNVLLQAEEKIYQYNLANQQSSIIYSGLKKDSEFYYSNQILSTFTGGKISTNQIQLH